MIDKNTPVDINIVESHEDKTKCDLPNGSQNESTKNKFESEQNAAVVLDVAILDSEEDTHDPTYQQPDTRRNPGSLSSESDSSSDGNIELFNYNDKLHYLNASPLKSL